MNHIGLFSGGGFELVIEAHDHTVLAYSEIEEFALKLLKYWFPNADNLGNIKNVKFKKYANRVDILTGGFPCQPFSYSGERKGTKDERHLWPEMLRAIRECKPPWVIAENVPGLITQQNGLAFEQVQTDLETEGYGIIPLLLPALSVGANHERTRLFFVAFNESFEMERSKYLEKTHSSNANSRKRNKLLPDVERESPTRTCIKSMFNDTLKREIPSFAPLCSLDDGIPTELDGYTFSKWRGLSNKMYGNAIHTHVFHNILTAIELYYETKKAI